MIKKGMFIGNRYEVLDKVGSGGMSDVYKAKDHKLNRFVAIKVLKLEFSKDKNFVSKFRVEAQSAARLEHTNIVNVYDVGEDSGLHYIVMELVEGITLKQYIARKKKLSVKEATSITIQIAQGIECAHNNQIIHRDIKPQNIIISREGKVKVTDFGIAKAASANTINGNAMGSVHYISPEQARGGYVDERSDIYSLGITMYEMLTGSVPFDGDNTVNIALQHIQNHVPDIRTIIPEIPVSIAKIVLKSTQNKSDRRYPKISSLIVDLKKSLLNPYEDFVRFDSEDDTGETTLITDSGIAKIGNENGEKENIINDVNDGNDIDVVNPKMDKLITIGGIVVGIIMFIIIIIIITIFVQSNNVEIPTTAPTEATTIDPQQAVVPDVVGMTEDEAEEALHDEALGYSYGEYVYDDDYEYGRICQQSYEAGSVIDKHTTVILTVSKGPERLEMPRELKGSKLSDVQSKLDEMGLTWEIKYEYNSAEVDTVLDITPSEGATVSKSEIVYLTVSRGTKITTTTIVPSLIGQKEKDAKSSITSAGLKVGEIRYINSEDVAEGKVIRQTIKSGGTIPKGTTVGLVVSLGPVEVTTEPETTTTPETVENIRQVTITKSQLYFEDDNTPVTEGVITVTYSNGQTEATNDVSTWETTVINVPVNTDGTECTYILMIGSRIVKSY